MNLLDVIVETSVDDSTSLSVLLRKCLLLASELENQQLRDWSNRELNGYGPEDSLPDYRRMSAPARGTFSGSFGAAIKNLMIPPSILEPQHRAFARTVLLRQAVSAYESVCKGGGQDVRLSWPPDLCLYYQSDLLEDYVLREASQSIALSSVIEMLGSIRNRVLNMALEIRSQLGDSSDLRHLPSIAAEKVRDTVAQNIFNGPTYFASPGSQISVSDITQTNISVTDRSSLDQALLGSGLERDDLDKLTEAIRSDHNSLGTSVTSWLKKTAPKVAMGGVKIGVEVAKSVLTDLLKQYLK